MKESKKFVMPSILALTSIFEKELEPKLKIGTDPILPKKKGASNIASKQKLAKMKGKATRKNRGKRRIK